MIYAASTKYVLTVCQDYFNFQVQPPKILNIVVMGASCCFCQRLEVVTKWAVCWGIVHLMPCNCLPQVSFIRTSFCSALSLISTLPSEVSHFLSILAFSTLVSIFRVDFPVNWQLSLVSPAPCQRRCGNGRKTYSKSIGFWNCSAGSIWLSASLSLNKNSSSTHGT
jgi:hypothetical protein